jgi:hypothetical protein
MRALRISTSCPLSRWRDWLTTRSASLLKYCFNFKSIVNYFSHTENNHVLTTQI